MLPDGPPFDDAPEFAKQLGEEEGRRPNVRPPSNPSPTQTLGAGGTVIIGGHIQSVEGDQRLTGREKYKTFSDIMANVGIVAAGVRFFLNLVSKARWKAVPADDSAQAEELAERTEEIMNDMETPWHRVVRRAAMYRFYGFSVHEWTAKNNDDGSIGMLDVSVIPQITVERWDTDRTGKVLGVVQRNPQTHDEIPIPREKVVYLVDDALSDSPEGLGLFRHLVEPAKRLRRYLQLEGFGYELDLRGVPVARGPFTELEQLVTNEQLTRAQADALKKPMQDFVDNHVKNPALGLLLDSKPWTTIDESGRPSNTPQWDVSLLDGGSYSLEEIAAAIVRTVKEIARILGVEQLLLGEDSAGSFALSRDKSQSLGLIIDSTLKELREQFQKDFLKPLWILNGWDEDLMPTLETETVTYRDIEQISAVLRDLASAGIMLDREDDAVAEVFELLGLSKLLPLLLDDPDAAFGAPVPNRQQPGQQNGTGNGDGQEPDDVPERDREEVGTNGASR